MLTPFISALDMHREILKLPTPSDEFQALASKISSTTDAGEGALVPLAVSLRQLGRDIIWCRFAPGDFSVFQQLGRRLAGRANGMSLYFTLADPSNNKFPTTPAPSHPNTPGPSTPLVSRPPSPERDETELKARLQRGEKGGTEDSEENESPVVEGSAFDEAKTPRSTRGKLALSLSRISLERTRTGGSQPSSPIVQSVRHHHHHHHHHHQHGQLQHNLLHLSLGRKKEYAVGVFESQRYMDLEARMLHDPHAEVYTQRMTRLLEEW